MLGLREFAYSPAILIFVGAEMLAVLIICSMTLTAVIYWASSHLHQGEDLADRICAASQGLCEAPQRMLFVTAIAIGLALLWRLLKS